MKPRYLLWAFLAFVMLLIAYQQHRRWVNMHKPCVPFVEGMTLEPGQCAYIQPFKVDIPKGHDD